MPAGGRSKARALGASWTGPTIPTTRCRRPVSEIPAFDFARDSAGDEEQPRIVMLQVFPDADLREVVRRIRDDLGVHGRGGLAAAASGSPACACC